ncbi:MAG: prephenate dehydrogenase [Chromatiales bacterium]
MQIERLAIIGVGLIGGSLARALKRAQAVGEVVGCGRNATELEKAIALGVIDHYSAEPADAVTGADMIVVATPVGAMRAVFERIAPRIASTAVITDVGSVKGSVIEVARAVLDASFPRFVPGHPIAGTERSGVSASFAELYVNHRVILTPEPETDAAAQARVRAMWEATGATVEEMPAAEHDEILAYTSHLPHMLAYALVDCLARAEPADALLRFAAGGFHDITRVASSHPVMWRDIALANREAMLKSLRLFNDSVAQITAAVERGDGEALAALFRRAKQTRDGIPRQPD